MTTARKTQIARKRTRFQNLEVAAVFDAYPKSLRLKLLFLRELIFETARATEGVGALEETLKWGQPSYLTIESKSGTTIRIDSIRSQPGRYAMYFHCQTTLIERFKEMFGNRFEYDGNRAIAFGVDDAVPIVELRHCVVLALTYRLARLDQRQPFVHR